LDRLTHARTLTLPAENSGCLVGTGHGSLAVQPGMDDIERKAIRAEGFDPDDPAVVTAIDLVRWELSMLGQ
jgi:hypothetical protein